MYFKRIVLKNVGPLRDVTYNFPFFEDGKPKPVVVVGTNGSGKSIFLSHLLNPLMTAQQLAIDNPEVEVDRTYRLRSPQYITTGETSHFSRIDFGDGFSCYEWQLGMTRTEYENQFGCPIFDASFAQIPADQASVFNPEFINRRDEVIKQFNSNCVLYFPPNRYEHPAWLNQHNLSAQAGFIERPLIQRLTKRRIIQDSPLSANKDWLLDIVLDRATYDMHVTQLQIPVSDHSGGQSTVPITAFFGFQGNAANVWEATQQLLTLVLRSDAKVRFGIGPRQNRRVSVMKNESPLIQNVFQLSTGQTSVLNFGLSILRDFDLTGVQFTSLGDVKGVAIIDEIDAHLHADLQCNVLPAMIKLFPQVQFIVTSHSPLFLLGMKKAFTDQDCEILSLPIGKAIECDEFSEFQAAFDRYSEANLFRVRIEAEIAKSKLHVVFVEGDYDIKYLHKAAQSLGREVVLADVQLCDGEGFGNLDRIWKSFDSRLATALPRSITLLYDCDTNKQDQDRDMVRKRVIPSSNGSCIAKGIENLFPLETIQRLRNSHPKFFDVTPEITRVVRGESEVVPEVCSINKSEKGNICAYLCENGTSDDFAGFSKVFDIISDCVNQI